MDVDTTFLTQWFGGAGAVFAVIFALFKAIWPEIKSQLDTRAELKREDQALREKEQQHTKEMIDAIKITNDLVAKNNEAFASHNTLFNLHVDALKDLREHQRSMRADLHRRFDVVEDLLDDATVGRTGLEKDQAAILANLRRVHGVHRFPDEEEEK